MLLVLAALAVLVAFAARWRANAIVTQLVTRYAVDQVALQSDSVYRLSPGPLRFTWSLRRFTLDSALLFTDSALNAARAEPLTDLTIVFKGCTVGGVSFSRLVLRRGVHATRFGCSSVSVNALVPASRDRPAPAAADSATTPGSFLVLQQRLQMPASVPRIIIRTLSLPKLALVLTRPGAMGGESRIELDQIALNARELAIDPGDSAAAARPLFARSIEISGADLHFHPDSVNVLRVGRLRGSLTDSTLELDDVSWEPQQTDLEIAHAGPYRRDPMRVRLGRLAATGVDARGLAYGSGIKARLLELDSLAISVYSDKRVPQDPSRRAHRTPQDWMAAVKLAINIDSVVFRDMRYVYREHRPGYDTEALLTFTDLEATATNVSHQPGRRTETLVSDSMRGPDVMRLETSCLFEGAGRLRLTFVVPLDSRGFDMTFGGGLGAMPATEVNRLVSASHPVQITRGDLDGIALNGLVRGGLTTGYVTPRYRGLTLAVTRQGSSGVLANGGLLGDAARSFASGKLNGERIRQNNPADSAAAPLTGRIYHPFTPDQTLPAYLWKGTREGLRGVILKPAS